MKILLDRHITDELKKNPNRGAIRAFFAGMDVDVGDITDGLPLEELYNGRIDLLITENRNAIIEARKTNLIDKVLTLDSFLEKIFAKHSELVNYKILNVKRLKFENINLYDTFFDSLKEDYPGFERWFAKKHDEEAYITVNSSNGMLLSFLYLKTEGKEEDYSNVNPVLPPKKRLKIGTFKVINNGFRLGERFLKIVFDNALKNQVEEIYVTIFDKRDEQKRLIDLLERWGFVYWGLKNEERVYVRDFSPRIDIDHLRATYPYISCRMNKYLVPIYPDYHTELLPDSILNTESPDDFIEDSPHRNGIGKVYISRALPPHPQKGDIMVFYRTGGYYKSVVTTLGVVEELHHDFANEEAFVRYCIRGSVFPEKDLRSMWNNSTKKPFVVKFLYVYSFPHRANMKELIELKVLAGTGDAPRGFKQITNEQFMTLIKATKSENSFIID